MIIWLASRIFGSPTLWAKMGVHALILAGVWYGLRMYGNSQWAKGEEKGRIAGFKQMEEVYKTQWKTRLDQLNALALEVEKDRNTFVANEIEAERVKQLLYDTLFRIRRSSEDSFREIQRRKDAAYAAINSIPADELDAAIRIELAANH